MISSVRVIQRGFGTQGSCVEINFQEEVTYLVNCPEMIQRSGLEAKVKYRKLGGVLFTRISAETFQGYPDLIMGVADFG